MHQSAKAPLLVARSPMVQARLRQYQVVGRHVPTEAQPNPTVFRMKIFAPNEVVAKSRFWYFLHQMHKMKKTTGEILDINELVERNSRIIKNYAIWLKYDSRSGTHNMYREYRDLTLTGAVDQLYAEMAGRHRARFRSIQIIRTGVVDAKDVKRAHTMQYHVIPTASSHSAATQQEPPRNLQSCASQHLLSLKNGSSHSRFDRNSRSKINFLSDLLGECRLLPQSCQCGEEGESVSLHLDKLPRRALRKRSFILENYFCQYVFNKVYAHVLFCSSSL
ncbi:60s ribosomal protein l18a [Nannochloropsis gaditana]|uniref:60s ribosomal protein l18a n=1 Tax=Nannochloropsis gaditana TaxID=72520 RepID=W7TKT1_9STRA|nr:60s ribosomal protein l18a [Nannochloropsis gaditana]